MLEVTKNKQQEGKMDLKNAEKIFSQAIDKITAEVGGNDKLIFPKEIMKP